MLKPRFLPHYWKRDWFLSMPMRRQTVAARASPSCYTESVQNPDMCRAPAPGLLDLLRRRELNGNDRQLYCKVCAGVACHPFLTTFTTTLCCMTAAATAANKGPCQFGVSGVRLVSPCVARSNLTAKNLCRTDKLVMLLRCKAEFSIVRRPCAHSACKGA